MEQVLEQIALWAAPVLLVLSIVNTLTKHYTKFNGILRIVMAVVERLSFLASKHSPRRAKLPGQSVKPDPILERLEDVAKQFDRMVKQKEARRHSLD